MGHWTSPSFSSQKTGKYDLAVCSYLYTCTSLAALQTERRSVFPTGSSGQEQFHLVEYAKQCRGPWAAGVGSASAQMINNKSKTIPAFTCPATILRTQPGELDVQIPSAEKKSYTSWQGLLWLLLITWHTRHRARELFQVTLTKMYFKFVNKHGQHIK